MQVDLLSRSSRITLLNPIVNEIVFVCPLQNYIKLSSTCYHCEFSCALSTVLFPQILYHKPGSSVHMDTRVCVARWCDVWDDRCDCSCSHSSHTEGVSHQCGCGCGRIDNSSVWAPFHSTDSGNLPPCCGCAHVPS